MTAEDASIDMSPPALLEGRNRQLGQLLLAERAVVYVSILSALLEFRRNHELEPLHEDLYVALRDTLDAAYTSEHYNQDLRQLLDWNLIDERIEKERLRGYRDTRRRKFRLRQDRVARRFTGRQDHVRQRK